jgi:hypothetical protein
MPGNLRTEIHLDGEGTDGAFCLLFDEPPVGWSLPAHRHQNETETIHIIEGEFEMEVNRERSRLRSGDTLHVPIGAIHSGGNVGPHAGRRMVLFSPAGIEGFFLEVGASTPDAEIDLAAVVTSAARHGCEFIREQSELE